MVTVSMEAISSQRQRAAAQSSKLMLFRLLPEADCGI